jgi:hypothetical protein
MGTIPCTSANPSAPTELDPGLQRPGRPGPLAPGSASQVDPAGSASSARAPRPAVGAVASILDRWRAK